MSIAETEIARLEAGLDALELARAEGGLSLGRVGAAVLPRVLAVVALVLAWQVAVTALRPSRLAYVYPGPSDVAASFAEQWAQGHIAVAVLNSLTRAVLGFAIAIVLGTALGIAMARARWLRASVGSIVSALQSLPSVVWVIPAVLFFSISNTAIYFVVVMGAFPSIANGVVSAYDHVPPLLLRVGRAMGADGVAFYRHIVIPASMPGYVAGLRQAWSFSWRSLMAAELITSSPALIGLGLGQLLDSGRVQSDMSLAFASIAVILAVGVLVEELVFAPLDRGIRRRRGLTADR